MEYLEPQKDLYGQSHIEDSPMWILAAEHDLFLFLLPTKEVGDTFDDSFSSLFLSDIDERIICPIPPSFFSSRLRQTKRRNPRLFRTCRRRALSLTSRGEREGGRSKHRWVLRLTKHFKKHVRSRRNPWESNILYCSSFFFLQTPSRRRPLPTHDFGCDVRSDAPGKEGTRSLPPSLSLFLFFMWAFVSKVKDAPASLVPLLPSLFFLLWKWYSQVRRVGKGKERDSNIQHSPEIQMLTFSGRRIFFPDGSLEAIWRWHDCRIPSQALTQHPLRRGTRREGGLRSPPPPNDIGRPPPHPIQEPWIQANGVLGGEAESRISSTYPGQGIHPHPHPQSSPPSRDRNIFATASKTRKKRRRSNLVLFSTCLSIPASDQGSSLQTWRYRRSSERRQEFVYNIYRGDNLLYTGLWQNMYVFTRLYLQIMSDSGIAQVGLRGCNVKKWSKLWLLNIIIMTTIYVLQHKYHELQCISHSFLFLCRHGIKAFCSYTTHTS